MQPTLGDLPTPTAAPFTSRLSASKWFRGVCLSVLTILVRIPALRAPNQLSYDDGVYRAAALAMRHGEFPFREVWSPQGPLFYPAIWLGDLIGFRTEIGPRITPLIAGIVATLCAAWLGERILRGGYWIAGVLTATSALLLRTTSAATGDGVAVAWSLVALCLAVAWSDRARSTPGFRVRDHLYWFVSIGSTIGVAVATKNLLSAPVAILIAWLIWRSSGLRAASVVAAIAATTVALAMVIIGWTVTYQQSIQYHLEKSAHQQFSERLRKVTTAFTQRDRVLFAVVLISTAVWVIQILIRRSVQSSSQHQTTDSESPTLPIFALGLWILGATALLLSESALFMNHVAILIVPLALLVCELTRRISSSFDEAKLLRAVAVSVVAIGLATIGNLFAKSGDFMRPRDASSAERAIAHAVASLPDDAEGLSDEPGVLSFEEVRIPGYFVDGSRMRLESPVDGIRVNADLILQEANRDHVCIVAVWNEDIWGTLSDLPAGLEQRNFAATELGDDRRMYLKQSEYCNNPSPQ
jgi:hypothetical protein